MHTAQLAVACLAAKLVASKASGQTAAYRTKETALPILAVLLAAVVRPALVLLLLAVARLPLRRVLLLLLPVARLPLRRVLLLLLLLLSAAIIRRCLPLALLLRVTLLVAAAVAVVVVAHCGRKLGGLVLGWVDAQPW